jgi:hypothetical protein
MTLTVEVPTEYRHDGILSDNIEAAKPSDNGAKKSDCGFY